MRAFGVSIFLSYLLFLTFQLCVSSNAQVRVDLLGGLGDFEYAGDTSWNVYIHPDYDFDANSGWVGDYRSTFTFKSSVSRRVGGSGVGDKLTIRLVRTSDALAVERVYEFTDGSGASSGCVEVNLGSDSSAANAAAKLKDVIDREQGVLGAGAVTVSVSGSVVYVKSNVHWGMTRFEDSDTSDARVSSVFNTWCYGFNRSSPDDSVGVGWVRKSGSNINPGTNCVYRIADGGVNGSKCQYMAIRNLNNTSGGSVLLTAIVPVSSKASDLHTGDYVTFSLDSIRMSGYNGLAAGASARYKIGIEMGGMVVERTLAASNVSFSEQIDAGPIAAGVRNVLVNVCVSVSGDVSGKEIGVYVDGAHLYVKRAEKPSEYATWQVPVPRERSIKTFIWGSGWDGDSYDIYDIASNCDSIVLGENFGKLGARLRYLNPNIKIYSYEIDAILDYRDSRGLDQWYANTPLKYAWVSANHPEWMYSDGQGGYVHSLETPTDCFMKLSNAACCTEWAERSRDIISRWRFDGVFIDVMVPLDEAWYNGRLVSPDREPWEVQYALRQMVPILKSAGQEVVQNICGYHLESAPGSVFMNPSWVPTAPYNTADYVANAPGTVADTYFQEWTFFVKSASADKNYYSREYWKACLDDMDAVKRWNLASGGAWSKRYNTLALGYDRADDPANGLNGWLRFSLCSYLLGQSDWTTFSTSIRSANVRWMDLSITRRLGSASGEHMAYNGDEYVRYRSYDPTTDGGVGGVVVVNGYPDQTKTFQVSFNAVDENDVAYPAGTNITLPPHTGRILLKMSPKVDISVSVPSQNVTPGQVVTVTVNYVNSGGIVADSVVVRGLVPSGMAYVAGSAEASGGTFDSASNTVSWNIGSLQAGQGGFRTFNAQVE